MKQFKVTNRSPAREAVNRRWNSSSNAPSVSFQDSESIINLEQKDNSLKRKEKTSSSGGGGNMDDITYRVRRLEEQLVDIKNELKDLPSKADLNNSNIELKMFIQTELAKILTEDKARLIANEQLKAYGTANENFVEGKVISSRNTMIIWMIATAISAGSLLFGALRYFGS